jgi:hypothetical protein
MCILLAVPSVSAVAEPVCESPGRLRRPGSQPAPWWSTAARAGQIAIVAFASDRDALDLTTAFGKLPFPVALDPPDNPDDPIGPVTRPWGVNQLPETLLVDRERIVQYHFQNVRDWDSPLANRCLKAFAAAVAIGFFETPFVNEVPLTASPVRQ